MFSLLKVARFSASEYLVLEDSTHGHELPVLARHGFVVRRGQVRFDGASPGAVPDEFCCVVMFRHDVARGTGTRLSSGAVVVKHTFVARERVPTSLCPPSTETYRVFKFGGVLVVVQDAVGVSMPWSTFTIPQWRDCVGVDVGMGSPEPHIEFRTTGPTRITRDMIQQLQSCVAIVVRTDGIKTVHVCVYQDRDSLVLQTSAFALEDTEDPPESPYEFSMRILHWIENE